jgi:hypothetical protein
MLNAASFGRPYSSTQPSDGKSEPRSRVIFAMAIRLTLPLVQSSEITKHVALDSLNDRIWVTVGHALFSRFWNHSRHRKHAMLSGGKCLTLTLMVNGLNSADINCGPSSTSMKKND